MSPLATTGNLIRAGRPQDARRLAELMTRGLHTRFSHLGQGVVILLHRHMTTSRHCLCVVAERQGRVAGYAAVLTSGHQFYREFLIRKGLLCGLLALPRLARISNLRTIFTALSYFPAAADNDPDAELVSIVVDQAVRSSGLGRDLWEGVVVGLQSRGIPELKISTDVGNERANRMYQNRGCRLIRQEPLYHDTEVNVYVYRVPQRPEC